MAIEAWMPVIVRIVTVHITNCTSPRSHFVGVAWPRVTSSIKTKACTIELTVLLCSWHYLCNIFKLNADAVEELSVLAEYALIVMRGLIPCIRQICRFLHRSALVRTKKMSEERVVLPKILNEGSCVPRLYTSLVARMMRKVARSCTAHSMMTASSINLLVKNAVQDGLLSETVDITRSFRCLQTASACSSQTSIVLLGSCWWWIVLSTIHLTQ